MSCPASGNKQGMKRDKLIGAIAGLTCLAAAFSASAQPVVSKNRYRPYQPVADITEGLSWPKGQALPTFATPASKMDMLTVQDLSKDEQITFSSLQGLVNRKQPRILLLDARAEEGKSTWAATLHLEAGGNYSRDNRYDLIAKYAKEISGVVLYDPVASPHYRNLAGTVAAQKQGIPVSNEVYAELKGRKIELPVLEDLTTLKMTSPIEIYQYLYDHYWEKCDKRVIVSAKPGDERSGGDYHHTRDIAAACGAAVVWLNTMDPAEKAMLKKFFADMKAGEALALGWYATERSGIPAATEFGIGTMPADFFVSGTVYAGTNHRINIPAVPKMPLLENKVYVCVIVSDGDNIQYTQHAMRRIWDRAAESRGKMPINWTIAPGLVDVAPGIMNYYYGSATPMDCFVTGPSGMGYLMPFNTLKERGADVGDNLTDPARMDGYARLTETYLQRSGLRVITIWDDATPMQRKSYEKNCRQLYGATVQNFKDVPSVAGSNENGRIRFDRLVVPYAGSYQHIRDSLSHEISRWDGKSPLFLSYQVTVWGEMKPNKLVELRDQMDRDFPDKVGFTRADHYFNLYNESAGLPFNLCLSADTTVRTSDSSELPFSLLDGTPSTLWTAAKAGEAWLGFDFGKAYQVNRYVIRHAGANGMAREFDNRDWTLKTSLDGKTWKTVDTVKGNSDNVTDIEFSKTSARYLKITLLNPGQDSTARIADVEIYGSN